MASLVGIIIVILGGLILACNGNGNVTVIDRCIVPKKPIFGSIFINHEEKTLKYKCDDGFWLVGGRSERNCMKKQHGAGSYYDWSGHEPYCIAIGRIVKKCPRINNPMNGFVTMVRKRPGQPQKAHFQCDPGYKLIPPEWQTLECLERNMRWSNDYPTCRVSGQATVADIAKGLNDKMDQLGGGSADAGGIQGNLRPGKTGLDLVFALDTSSSIGPDSMKKAKKFIKIIIGKFGVSNRADGGSNGTRIALLTFNDKTTIVFNLNDKNVRSVEAAHEAIDALKSDGGGTNFYGLFTKINIEIDARLFGSKAQNESPHVKKRVENANRAIFIVTDAKDTSHVNDKDPSMSKVKKIARTLRDNGDFEIFTIGIGSNIDKKMMADIASRPFYEHVFEIKKFADLNEIGDIISEENIDFGKCGVSGNTEAGQDGDSDPGAWPWIGWITVLQSDGKVITCGGALLCDNWFVTLASCVTETSDNILRPVDGYMINLYMGDHKIDAFEENDWMVAVKNVHVHPNYTGLANDYGVATFDIAMLEIDDDNTTMLKLNKFVRPLCFMESRVNTSYAEGLALMSAYKSLSSKLMGTVAGWGHMGRQKIMKSKGVFPKASLKQTEREVQSDAICRERYPGIDTDQFVCVGNVQSPEFNSCYGDIGGPLMVETDGRRYTFLGLSLNTERCKDLYKFSLFLNVLHPEINTWVQRQMRGCNRVEEPIPYVEEDVDVLEPHDGDDDDGHDAAEVIEDDANRSSDGDESHDANDRGDDDGSEILWEE